MSISLPFENKLPCGVCDFSCVEDKLIDCRAKSRIPQSAASIIVYLFPYYLGEGAYTASNISKYAVPKDYHLVVGEYLSEAVKELQERFPQNEFQWFCDNSPVPEVYAAVKAGLGVKGENGLLINETYGSYCFIGEVVTDRAMPSSQESTGKCLSCGKCREKCPGGALGDSFSRDLCLSHITQIKRELTPEQSLLVKKGGIAWGCDACQDNCPMNKNIPVTPIEEFVKSSLPVYNAGDSIDERAFAWRGRGVIERNLKIICCQDK